jgi:hypothetical protein
MITILQDRDLDIVNLNEDINTLIGKEEQINLYSVE